MTLHSDPEVDKVFNAYPEHVRGKLVYLRELIIDTARETEGIESLEETLKWSEPSYLAKKGSTLRIDWKSKTPDQYAMYFKCTSRLVDTFKIVYKEQFNYEGTRAIVFNMDDEVPEKELKSCIRAALRYHVIKHEPLLGM